jgi:acetyl esterase/lipase
MSFPPPTKDWASLSKPNPELETLLPLLGGYQLVTPNTTIHSLRALSAGRKPSQPLADVIEKDLQIPMRDGALNRARSYTPRKPPTGGMPLLVLVYGGSWLMGQLEQEEPNCRAWASKLGGVAVSLDHRHAPEHPFPGPHNDIYDGVKWVCFTVKPGDFC